MYILNDITVIPCVLVTLSSVVVDFSVGAILFILEHRSSSDELGCSSSCYRHIVIIIIISASALLTVS